LARVARQYEHIVIDTATRPALEELRDLDAHINSVDLIADAFRDDLVVLGGVLTDRCLAIYYRPSDSPPLAQQDNQSPAVAAR
jgi:tRNA(adenine34) deaminase